MTEQLALNVILQKRTVGLPLIYLRDTQDLGPYMVLGVTDT